MLACRPVGLSACLLGGARGTQLFCATDHCGTPLETSRGTSRETSRETPRETLVITSLVKLV